VPSVTWRPSAAAQYTQALDYIAERNEAAAKHLEERIIKSMKVLETAPGAGRPGRVPNTREWVVHPNYLVIYRISRAGITILRFLHARQRYP
jgi:toxin ParE1/3/4